MPTQAYEKYGVPTAPADPDAEYMTIQETAYVLHMSVTHARKLARRTGLYSRTGRRIVTNKADRAGIYEAQHAGGQPIRRPRRTTARKRPATSGSATPKAA